MYNWSGVQISNIGGWGASPPKANNEQTFRREEDISAGELFCLGREFVLGNTFTFIKMAFKMSQWDRSIVCTYCLNIWLVFRDHQGYEDDSEALVVFGAKGAPLSFKWSNELKQEKKGIIAMFLKCNVWGAF